MEPIDHAPHAYIPFRPAVKSSQPRGILLCKVSINDWNNKIKRQYFAKVWTICDCFYPHLYLIILANCTK